MGNEIERKFLVSSEIYKTLADGILYLQGYLSVDIERTVRLRIAGEQGILTIKGIRKGISRMEFEYKIPVEDARMMLEKLCLPPFIEKHRYTIPFKDMIWEVDEFHRENEGLVVAEIELDYEDQGFEKPDWVGREVTDDPKYLNSNLVINPYNSW